MAYTDDWLTQRSPALASRSFGVSSPPPPGTPALSQSSSSVASSTMSSSELDRHAHATYTQKAPISINTSTLPRSNTSHAFVTGTQNGQNAPTQASMASVHEKGIFAYQSKYLSRTGSVQSLSNMPHSQSSMNLTSAPSSSQLPRAPTMSNISSRTGAQGDSRAQQQQQHQQPSKRTTWTPGHKLPGSNSVSSVDDIMGRFGGGGSTRAGSSPYTSNLPPRSGTPTGTSFPRPHSPVKQAGTYSTPLASAAFPSSQSSTWRSNLSRSATQRSDTENVSPFPSSHGVGNGSSNVGDKTHVSTTTSSHSSTLPASRRFNSTPSSPTSYTSSNRPLSPTTYGSSATTPSSPPPSAHVESEIMRSSFSSGVGQGHRSKQASVHIGSVADLGQSSVGMLRSFRDFAISDSNTSSTSGRESPVSVGLARTFTVSNINGSSRAHRRTQTLPALGDVGSPRTSSYKRERHDSTSSDNTNLQSRPSRYGQPAATGRLNMHGLDRLSERSDTSMMDDTPDSAKFVPPADAGAIVIPGITVGSDSVAGMSGRLRLARQPTQTRYGTLPSVTMKAMESQRQCLQAYEYLCHVSEAKEWLVHCLSAHPLSPSTTGSSPDLGTPSSAFSPVGSTTSGNSPYIEGDDDDPSGLSNKSVVELEEALRNGVALARLSRAFMGEKAVPRIFTAPRPRFRHSDNINYFFKFTQQVGLPEIFCFELTDLYDAKNLPKVIYCIHALSHLLARRGLAERISDHVGKVEFTDEELRNKQKGLDAAGVTLPSFGNIGRQLAKEINEEPEEQEETENEVRERLLQAAMPDIVKLQSIIRGHTARSRHEHKQDSIQRATFTYIAFQAQCRGKLAHIRLARQMTDRKRLLQSSTPFVIKFQAQARKALVQKQFFSNIAQLDRHDNAMTKLQALIRGRIARERYNTLLVDLSERIETVIAIQAQVRGLLARRSLLHRVRKLRSSEKQVEGFQSVIRGVLARKAQAKVAQDVSKVEVVRSVGNVQAFARGALTRKRQQQQSKALGFVLPDVLGLQAQVRGYIARKRFWTWYTHLHSSHDQATRLQALLKGAVLRRSLYHKLAHYYQNMDKVVKIQAVFRKKQQLDAYKQLMKGTNVPISTIKNFIHLLADNDNDYREEVEVEQLKKTVITKIRANQALEADVSDLDIKIALLVKNKMTLDDIERSRRQNGTLGHKQRNSVLAAAKDPFALASMDKSTMRKLELYQQMFYLLQTKPDYLARLFFRLSRIEMGDRARKAVEGVVLTLFGYAQNSREEFLLLKLFQRSIHEEVMGISSLQEFVKGDFVFMKLVVQYGRGTKERKFLQDTLAPLVQEVASDGALDLETDPLAIYRSCIAKEEMEQGLVSQRPIEGVNHQKALEDPEVRTIFIRHLQLLRAKTDRFLTGIFSSTPRMPFGMRYIAREIFRALEIKFVKESKEALIRVVGHFLYYRYINPAIVAPEGFDVVSETVGPAQRKNLAAISKMLNQISVGRQFAEENPYLSPLNEYIAYGSERFRSWFFSVLDVPDAETQFSADEYLDHSLPHKPIIYISPNEIYSMHSLVLQNLDAIADSNRDPLRVLLGELGGAPLTASAELDQARAGEIAMTLKGKFEEEDDPNSEEKALFGATKRYVIYLLKVQPGQTLLEILIDEVTAYHEEAWQMVLSEELATDRVQAARRLKDSPHLVSAVEDVRNLSFRQLKARCLENMLELEKFGRVKRDDNFQDMLNAIAQDIRNKHRKRIVRQREIQSMEGTIINLDGKYKYLEQQLAAFKSFVDSTKTTIQKKGKRRLVIPFSAQYFHNRELARTGKVPKFGSYKYTAKNLADKGILLSIEGFSPRQYDHISLTISSDEVGIFIVEASMMGLSGGHDPVELSMDELLQAQFNGVQVLNLGGMAKCNLNLLLSLINKKFYS